MEVARWWKWPDGRGSLQCTQNEDLGKDLAEISFSGVKSLPWHTHWFGLAQEKKPINYRPGGILGYSTPELVPRTRGGNLLDRMPSRFRFAEIADVIRAFRVVRRPIPIKTLDPFDVFNGALLDLR